MVGRWEIWTDAARTGGEEGKKGAEEDGGDHQRLSPAFSESLSSLLTSLAQITKKSSQKASQCSWRRAEEAISSRPLDI